MEEIVTMKEFKNIFNNIKSNWYIREPIYDSTVRAPKSYEGFFLAALALSFFFVPLTVGIFG